MHSSISALDKAHQAVTELSSDYHYLVSMAAAALHTAQTAESRHAANSKALGPHWPAFFEEVGNANLSLISEQGSPVVFLPAGSGRFVAQDDPQQQQGVIIEEGSGFVHQRRDGQKWHYNEYGLLTRISDRNGLGIDFSRDVDGRMHTITAGQRVVNLRYEQGLLRGISATGGINLSYGYDTQKRLSSVTDASGDTVQYKYDGDYLTHIVKPDKSFLQYDYISTAGRVVCEQTQDEEQALEHFEYDFANRTTLYVDPEGGQHRYWFDEKLRYAREEHPAGYYKSYQYDGSGNLIRTEEPGWVLRYGYDSRGNRTRIDYQDYSYESWTYDSNDQVTGYHDRDGVFYTYTRDTVGNLTSVRQGTVVTATYGWQNGRLRTVSERGVQRTYTYDGNGFIDSILLPDGSADHFENDAWGRPLVHTDRLNRQTVREYDKEGRVRVERFPGGLERRFAYDWRKDLVEVVELDTRTGQSNTTVLKYDQRHLLVEKVDAAGVVSKYSYRDDGKLESALLDGLWQSDNQYSPGGYLDKSTQSLVGQEGQYSESYEYDSMGRLTFVRRPQGRDSEYQYAHNGRLKAEVDALGRVQQYNYSAAGRLEASIGPHHDQLDYRYEADGSLSSLSRPGKATDEVLLIKDQFGRIKERVDAGGSRWGYVYDNQGRLENETLNGQWYRSYRYDAVGRLLELRDGEDRVLEAWNYHTDGRSAERLDGLGNATRVELDAWGRTLRLVDAEGRSRSFVYDGLGRVVQAIDGYGTSEYYEYNTLGKLAKRTDREGLVTQYQYDHRGQLVRVFDVMGTAWSGQYDAAGRLVAEQGRPGTEAGYQWDKLDRLVSRSSGDQVLERFAYDDDANVVQREDARGQLSEQSLDAQGRVVAERSRGGYSATRSYDQAGRLHETVSYGGVRTLRTYDALGNLVWQQSDGEAPSTWTYDSVDRLLRAESPSGLLEYSYDAAGNLSTIKDHAAGETISYRYDRSGLRTAMTRGGSSVSYTYGQNGELLTLVDDGVSIRFAYDKAGREAARYYANGIRIETMYDPVGRIEAIREVRGSSGVILRAYGYVYDSRGRIAFKIDERGRYTSYQYDSAGRLSQVLYPFDSGKVEADRAEAERLSLRVVEANPLAERQMINSETSQQLTQALTRALGFSRGSVGHQLSWSERFSYDANGNRLTKLTGWGILHYEYGADDQLLKAGVARFEYDQDGRLIEERDAKSMTSYQYDSSNRPILVTKQTLTDASSETIRYSYDALGRRVERIVESRMVGSVRTGRGSGLTSGLGTRSLYDGFSFDETRSIAVRSDGSALPEYGQVASPGASSAGSRYRYWDEASGGFVGGGTGSASGAGGAGSATSGGSTAANVIPGGRSRNLVQAYGQTVAVRSGGSVYYTGQDRLGSVESVSNNDGSLLDRYEYDAFGGSIGGDVSSGLGLGYAGKPYDEFTGKYNYGFRDYAPEQA
ncbi:MAG: hypothetical protein KKI09_01745, partial [Spirochaetes bacterium]|nr:hypothetical protein [Spirochaetota bacterium]